MMDQQAKWRGWQQAHQRALGELQAAETAYHRLTAEQAFGRPDDEARTRRADALARLDQLRLRLDQIREQQPVDR